MNTTYLCSSYSGDFQRRLARLWVLFIWKLCVGYWPALLRWYKNFQKRCFTLCKTNNKLKFFLLRTCEKPKSAQRMASPRNVTLDRYRIHFPIFNDGIHFTVVLGIRLRMFRGVHHFPSLTMERRRGEFTQFSNEFPCICVTPSRILDDQNVPRIEVIDISLLCDNIKADVTRCEEVFPSLNVSVSSVITNFHLTLAAVTCRGS